MMHKCLFSIFALTGIAAACPDVYFIRHGEKPGDGGKGLSADGLERAQCIRDVFGAHSDYDIGYILAQRPKKNGKRARPYETVKPLAEDLGIEVDTSCDRDDPACVKEAVESYEGGGNILICWEHHRMTDLAEELGFEDAPLYPDDRYDLIWTDPYPYTRFADISSENCPGLD
ncbi:phosphoglycerate mutase family protein [Penicillium chermesinum]|uniref:Phosphoglycerate mutase family protein n=1 Tax=Penicillium chermesinum TaxID=63820 RepID=A0A9W9PJ25_9EURO|nr:phosphoglycerate mutase family protein [Penicillium chermesinum]KAJ5247680.1 phosphoglycerate mutase family protein [Penicillium chermesinum]KAJ6151444.1 phosphoglycerate mutase family protein [Penicillium chermesinum]